MSIPFRRLIELIKYKARELGMEVVEVDESYTSKTSPFADIKRVQSLGERKKKLKEELKKEEREERKREIEKKLKKVEKEIEKVGKGERKGNVFKDKVINKVFHADLVGALNILRVGAKLLKLGFYENLKVLFIKLCNPIRLKLMDFFYEVSPESLYGIGGSRQGRNIPAGVGGETGFAIS